MKTRGIIEALLIDREDGASDICAPHIGSFTASVAVNAVVGGPVPLGEFRIGNRDWTLMLPEGVEGRVVDLVRDARGATAEYKDVLLVLQRGALDQAIDGGSVQAGETFSGEVFRAPMDGQFYRRPSPDEPAFASVGDVIEPGATVGLIEVMKFFYPVTFDGRHAARVTKVTVDTARPVTSGEVIFVFEPVSS